MGIRRTPLAEIRVPDRRLGRHIRHDERSRQHPAERTGQIVSVAHQARGLPLDQGEIGSCTANALVGALNADPNYHAGHTVGTEADAIELYKLETRNEGQPYPPNDPGGSGLEVCKAAQQLGWLTSYQHAFDLQHALEALAIRPVIFGVNWFEGFDKPDANGLIAISGQVRGGHEIVALEIVAEHELVGFAQSWGLGYGVPDAKVGMPAGGVFYMTFTTLGELLSQQGDATVPVA